MIKPGLHTGLSPLLDTPLSPLLFVAVGGSSCRSTQVGPDRTPRRLKIYIGNTMSNLDPPLSRLKLPVEQLKLLAGQLKSLVEQLESLAGQLKLSVDTSGSRSGTKAVENIHREHDVQSGPTPRSQPRKTAEERGGGEGAPQPTSCQNRGGGGTGTGFFRRREGGAATGVLTKGERWHRPEESGKGLAGDDSQCLPLLLQLVQRFGALHKLNKAMAKHAAPSTGKLDLYHRLWLRSWSAVAEAVPLAARSVGRAVGNIQHSHALCGPSGRRPKTWSKSRKNGADPIFPSFPNSPWRGLSNSIFKPYGNPLGAVQRLGQSHGKMGPTPFFQVTVCNQYLRFLRAVCASRFPLVWAI
eukprot:g65253.t1